MLRCADGSLYVGLTRHEQPEARVWQHNSGADPKAYTFIRRPVELVWAEHFDLVTDAISCERRLKSWRREKKLAVIGRDYASLKGMGSRAKKPGRAS